MIASEYCFVTVLTIVSERINFCKRKIVICFVFCLSQVKNHARVLISRGKLSTIVKLRIYLRELKTWSQFRIGFYFTESDHSN